MTLTGVSSMATRHVLADLAAAYERVCGHAISIESVGGVEAARRIEAREPFDFVALAAEAMERLEASGRIVRGTRTDIVRSGIAIAVAKGAAKPAIHDEEAVRRAVLAAPRVGYSTGPSGAYLLRLFERWGIAEALRPRLVQAPAGVAVGTLIARGAVDLGFQQLSELLPHEDIQVVGPLPPAIQHMTVFSAAVCATSSNADATRGLLRFLASADAESAKRRHGMEPAGP